uniref:LOB domain-containing protein n=1 Tax=Chenopodium quinoa TaxID=63459 RepID=A0A803L8H7_CHEQI
MEEHYISKLNFTWPQGSDDSGCALRGSRIQKFVLRFSSSKESQEFMESLKSVKERRNCSSLSLSVLNEGVNEEHTPLRLPSINQEHDPYSCSEGVDEEHRPLLLPSIIQEHDPYSCSEEAAQDLAVGNTDVALPQSFSALLADCCTETNLGIPQVPAEDLNRFYKEVSFRSLTMSIIQLLDASPSCTLQVYADVITSGFNLLRNKHEFMDCEKYMSSNPKTANKKKVDTKMASSSSYNSPCAACKFLRRKCMPGCIFAPYFPPEEPQKFANVHKIFGASNVTKLLNELLPHQREDAVNSLAYEAEARVRDPVYGCVGAISYLQRQFGSYYQPSDLNSQMMQPYPYLPWNDMNNVDQRGGDDDQGNM